MILAGAGFLLGLHFDLEWLTYLIVPGIGVLLLVASVSLRHWGMMLAGNLSITLGLLSLFVSGPWSRLPLTDRIGGAFLAFSFSWFSVMLLSLLVFHRSAWWALIPGGLSLAAGGAFLFSRLQFLDLVLYTLVGLGIALLTWGLVSRLFGLIIAGCLLLGIGPGVYAAWATPLESNALARVGIMLVIFAMGWFMITLLSRRVTPKFIWWPLIPGGVLAMVGWGLYIGGNPNNALNFIGNTGSIGIILVGVYLLLLRKGIHH
jgi:hypothetical protein